MRSCTLLVAFALGCATTRPDRPAWLDAPPNQCVLGHVGLTFRRATALRLASDDARYQLALRLLGPTVVAKALDTGDAVREAVLQTLEGPLVATPIRALWHETRPGPDRGATYALACDGRAPGAGERTDVPGWVLNLPRRSGELCALGIAGPTLDPGDQPGAAEDDAREELGAAMSAYVKVAWADLPDADPVTAGSTEVPIEAAQAAAVAAARATWADPDGRGPLGEAGLVYAMVCVPWR